MRCLVVVTLLALASPALAEGQLPASVTVPIKPGVDVVMENYGHTSFKTKGDDVVVAGKHWETRLDASKLPGDERQKWKTITDALVKGGWQFVVSDQQSNPPYASMKLVKGGKESWLFIWVSDDSPFEVVEKGDPPNKLTLAAPTDGIAKVGDKDDFPFMKRFPGAKLTSTEHNSDVPFYVTLEAGKDPVMIASGMTVKHYEIPAHTSGIEEEVVYKAALKAAGWTIVEENDAVTTNDPNLTAHYSKGPIDLWAHVHTGGTIQVGDAGSERGSAKLKADLDKLCKVEIYGVNFDFDKATLRADATPALDAIAKLLGDYKDLKVELGGHTDNVGERGYNQKLSEQRVGTVKTWLTKKGIAADRMTTHGYADTVPLVPNDSPQNQAKNRRVELKKLDCKK